MMDLIERQAAIDAIEEVDWFHQNKNKDMVSGANSSEHQAWYKADDIYKTLEALPSAQPEPQWIPVSERLPDELTEVNITWINTNPEPYYEFIKGKPNTGSAVYYKGRWYWYSAVCVEYLAEYGFSSDDDMDDAIKVIAWMPLPEPYAERRTDDCV